MATIQHRRNIKQNWENVNPVLAAGELGLEIGVNGAPDRFKLGNGLSTWTQLDYFVGETEIGFDAERLSQEALDGRYAPLWQPSTAYAIGSPVLLPNGKLGTRTAAGTSRANFDATELALWTVETAALPSGGTTGQFLSKTSGGAGWADAPAGSLPAGGTAGQFLSKTESGADWANAPAGGSFSNTLTKLFNTTLTASPATGQKVAALASATGIAAGWEVILSSDTGFSERKVVASVAGLNVTFTTNINGNHVSGAMVTYSNQPLDADYLTATTAQQVTGSKDFRGPMRFQRPVPASPGLQPYDSFDFVNAVFTSRAQGGGSIVAKAEGDMSAGLIDWIHAGILANSGYLMHMTHSPTSKGTFFGLGVQGDGGGAILIAKDGPKGTGLSIDQKGVVTHPAAYGQYMMQSSRFADMSRWQQMQPGVAPLINLLSAGHTPWPDQRIQNWISSTIPQSNLGYVDASNGQFVWQQPIIADATRPNTAASLRYKGRGTSIQNQMWLDENGPQPGGALDTGTAVRLFAATGQFVYSGQLRMSKNAQGILLAVSAGAQRIGGESMQTVLEASAVAVKAVGAALESQPLAVPVVGTLVVAGTPGSTTYGYRVAAVNTKGTTIASATVTTSTGPAALNGTDKITVPWTHVQGATAYKVYGRTPGSEQLLATIGQAARTVSDAKMFAATTRTVTDVVCTAQSNTITSATAAFTADDIGRRVQIPGQGYNNYDLDTYITAVSNGTTAILAYSPNTSATGRTATVSSPAYTAVESATAAFTAADVGKAVQISGAAASGGILYAYIEQYISAQRVILNTTAVTSVSGASMTITGGTPALSFVDDGTLTPSGGLPGASAGQTAKIVPWLSQTGNVAEFFDNTLAVTQRVNRSGRLIQKITTAPALADLADGESTQWTDPATGDLKFTSRIGGALKTATITAS